jgi:hypothetical protein
MCPHVFFFLPQELRVTKQLRVCGSALDDAARECEELAAAVAARCDARMLTYADICSRRGKALNLLAFLVQKYQY